MTEAEKEVNKTPVVTQKTEEKVEYTYAILQESNGEEYESWLYFIRYQGNEEALAHLQKQLESVDWTMDDDLSCFDLETNFLVCERTAKEMTKVDLNHHSFHRKFDGKLEKIEIGLKKGQSDSKKIRKVFKLLGYGQIEDFIDGEDIDPEDLESGSESSSSEDDEESESDSSSSDEEDKQENKTKKGILPKASTKIEIPRYAKAKETKAKANKRK